MRQGDAWDETRWFSHEAGDSHKKAGKNLKSDNCGGEKVLGTFAQWPA
jgi:hypothetical protein